MTRILAIETSCDETAAAVVAEGRHILSNRVASQIELHRRFGGVYPEVASRQHVLTIQPVIEDALAEASVAHVRELDAIAVTHGPGLAGSLLVGVNLAKGLAFASGLPLIAVNHLEGHVYSNWMRTEGHAGALDIFPTLILIVSGGHTELVLMEGHCRYHLLGATLDDAAGEAFDKVARLLALGYPGGPAIQAAAKIGDAHRFQLPRPLSRRVGRTHKKDGSALSTPTFLPGHGEHRFNFSFSGLKTAVLNLMRQLEREGTDSRQTQTVADIAAGFQMAVVDVLVGKTAAAAAAFAVKQVCICGGVSANRALRQRAEQHFGKVALPLHCPPLFLCTDNAAMIGAAAYFQSQFTALRAHEALALNVYANLPLAGSLRPN